MTSHAMRLLGQRFLLRRVHAAGNITSLQACWSTAHPQGKTESQDMFNRKSFTEPLTGGVCKTWYIAPRSCSGRAFSAVAETVETSNMEKCFDIMTEGTERFLVANRELNAGKVLFDGVGGEFTTYRTRHSIQVGHGKHVTVDNESDLMNHSCTPNCMMEVVDGGKGHDAFIRITVRDSNIPKGDLLTLDYNAMEVDMSHPFECNCGSANCHGHISGFAKLPLVAKEEYVKGRPDGSPPMTKVVREWMLANCDKHV